MKNRHRFQNQYQNPKSASALPQSPTANLNQTNNHHGESASVKPQAVIEKSSQTSISVRSPRDKVAAVAYQIYLQEGCPQGRDLQHWLEAEAQLAAASPMTLKMEVTVKTETTVKNEVVATAKRDMPGIKLAVNGSNYRESLMPPTRPNSKPWYCSIGKSPVMRARTLFGQRFINAVKS